MTDHQPTAPVVPAAPWIGGKHRLAKKIIERLQPIPHLCYCEPFIGMGGIFLRRPWRSKSEVINDLSTDVVTLFRILQRHYVAFMEMLRWQITSREAFERLREANPDSLTDLERAARFLYLQRLSFGGKPSHASFGTTTTQPARFDVLKLAGILESVHERLSAVVIERMPYQDLIERYDRPATLFYLDPPYHGCEDYYGEGMFERADFERLAEQLGGIQGKFLMSLNDTPEVRRTFARFDLEAVALSYSVNAKTAGKKYDELLISNVPRGGS